MRYPEKYFVLLVAWAALLAAMGFDRLRKDETLRPWRVLALLAVLLSMFLLVGVFADFPLARLVRGGAARGIFAATGLLSLFWLRRRQSSLFLPLAVAVVALDLVTTLWHLQPFADAVVTQRLPPVAKAILNTTNNKGMAPRLYRSGKATDNVSRFLRLGNFADTETLWMLTLTPNLSSVFGIATVPGYDAATLGTLNAFWEEGLEFRATLLRLLAVEYALLPVKDPTIADQRGAAYEAIMDPLPGTRLYRVKDPLPRAYMAWATTVVSDKEALLRLFTPEVADGKLALVAEGQSDALPVAGVGAAGQCQSKAEGPNRVIARCSATREGLAVFVEQYAPQWSATVDGVPTQLLRVNHVMRGVRLGPGRHKIVMTYRAPGIRWAAALSAGATVALMVLLLLNGSRPTKRKRGPLEAPLHEISSV
jgi:hypothetical protein